MLGLLDRWLFKLEAALAAVAGLVIFLMMFLVSAEVVSRRLLNMPIPGQVDLVTLTMVAFGVLCISYCYRRAGHIRMDLLLNVAGPRGRWLCELFAVALALVVLTAIIPGAWTHFLRAYEFGDTSIGVGLPTWPSKLAVTIGLGVFWLRLALQVFVFGRLALDPNLDPIGVPTPPDPREEIDEA